MPRKPYKKPEDLLVNKTFKVRPTQITDLHDASRIEGVTSNELVRQGIDQIVKPILNKKKE